MTLLDSDDFSHPSAFGYKGRLARAIPFWKTFCASSLVLCWIKNGYSIQWLDQPPTPYSAVNHTSANENAEYVTKTVADLLAKGSITEVMGAPKVVSPPSVVWRRGKPRLVLDLSWVNSFIDRENIKFKYETIMQVPSIFEPVDLLFTVDLESAYHHVDMHPDMWDYLGLEWQEKFYVFTVLPFGLSSACWVFTKLTRELVGKWRSQGIRLLHYLDDMAFGVPRDPDGGHRKFDNVVKLVIKDITSAGFTVSFPKLDIAPTPMKTVLGFLVDAQLGELRVMTRRVDEMRDTLAAILSKCRRCPVRLLAKLAGQILSMSPAVGPSARIFTRALYRLINTKPLRVWDWHLTVDSAAMAELKFWQDNFDSVHGRPLWPSLRVQNFLFTDAGAAGWGAVSFDNDNQLWYKCLFQPQEIFSLPGVDIAQGYLTPEEQLLSSTWRELTAIERALLSVGHRLSIGSQVKLYTDNQAVAYIWKSGSKNPDLNDITVRIFKICQEKKLVLDIIWIPRCFNEAADFLSKVEDKDDWKLNPVMFNKLDRLWGPHTFDRFASSTNRQCEQFSSLFWCPGTRGLDAFTFDWSQENNWLNPPFVLIGRVIDYLQECRAHGTLIVPFWPKRSWWHKLRSPDGQAWHPAIKAWRELGRATDLFLPGPSLANTREIEHSVQAAGLPPELRDQVDQLPLTLLRSLAKSTVSRYESAWKFFQQWASLHKLACFPADPLTVALYCQQMVQSGSSYSSVKAASAAINKVHELSGKSSPTGSPLVKAMLEAAQRNPAALTNKKEPLLWEHVEKITGALLSFDSPLPDVMICTAISVGFCGFFRASDLISIFADQIKFVPGGMEVFLESRKNDPYREGHRIMVSGVANSFACPVSLTQLLMLRANLQGHRPLFSACKNGVYGSAPISYTQLRELMLNAFAKAGLDREKYGTHSLRAGGATLAANKGVSDRLWMEHGGWKSEKSARGYIKTSTDAKLSVNNTMFS